MVIKVYISGISGLKEVKKRQQRICMILDSKHIEYQCIDITESGRDEEKKFLQEKCTTDDQSKFPMTPQVFNEDDYCGDYDQFDLANENDTLESFLKIPVTNVSSANLNLSNGIDSKKNEEINIDDPVPVIEHEPSKEFEGKDETIADSSSFNTAEDLAMSEQTVPLNIEEQNESQISEDPYHETPYKESTSEIESTEMEHDSQNVANTEINNDDTVEVLVDSSGDGNDSQDTNVEA